jgi:hypothetical protein
MKTRRLAAAVLFSVLPVLPLTSPAFAQEDASTLQARARFKEGVEAYDKGKFEEARLSFLQAYTLRKHPAVLLNLAQSSARSNHPLEAAKYFQQFLKESTTATTQQKKDAETGLAEVRQKIGRIDVVAPPGTEISLDDQGKVGTTPMDPIDVDIGNHTVKSPTQTLTVTAVAGQKVEARFSAPAAAAPPPVAAAPVATTPEPTAAPPPKETIGADTGTTKSSGFLSPPANMVPVYVGVGVAAVGFGSAVVFALLKNSAQSKADKVAQQIREGAIARGLPTQGACNNPSAGDLQSACRTLRNNNDDVDTDAIVANVSLGVGIAGALFAGIWYLAAPKKDEAKAAAFTPFGGYRSAGFSLTF